MRRGPSLEPRRKLGAGYRKETRNGGPYNVSACDGPRGHTHVHHCRSVTATNARIFRIFLVTVSTPCLPSRDQSAQAFPVFTALSPPPQIKNAHVTGKAWDRGYPNIILAPEGLHFILKVSSLPLISARIIHVQCMSPWRSMMLASPQ